MIGIVIVGHGQLGSSLLHAVEHVLGTQERMSAVDVASGADLAAVEAEIAGEIEKARDPVGRDGVIVFADIGGGTPSNMCLKAMSGTHTVVIGGFNLPMILTITKARSRGSLEQVAQLGVEAGRKYLDFLTPVDVRAKAYIDG